MAYFNNICWCFLCIVFLNELETAKIDLIEVLKSEDSNPLGNYDILTEYVDYHNTQKKLKDDLTIKHNNVKKDTNTVMCQRLFNTIYGSKNQHLRCLEALNKKKQGNDYILDMPREKYFKRLKLVRQDDIPFAGFSQDYLDVRDLVRQGFANDYVDDNDFVLRSIPAAVDCKQEVDKSGNIIESCLPISRKTLLSSKDRIGNLKLNLENSAESSSESDNSSDGKNKDALRKKRKRYKVVSKKDSRSVENDEKQDSDLYYFEKEAGTSFSIQDSSSVEVTTTTKKTTPKKSNKAKYIEPLDNEKYMYLQGNNYYDKGNFRRNGRNKFRRGYRLTHFLPKRYHWDEEQLHDLGYFWFNGSKGRYKNYEHM